MLYGLSLSFCVASMIKNNIPISDVKAIFTGCLFDRESFASIISQYQAVYWREFSYQAADLAWKLFHAGKLIQTKDFPVPCIAHNGCVKREDSELIKSGWWVRHLTDVYFTPYLSFLDYKSLVCRECGKQQLTCRCLREAAVALQTPAERRTAHQKHLVEIFKEVQS